MTTVYSKAEQHWLATIQGCANKQKINITHPLTESQFIAMKYLILPVPICFQNLWKQFSHNISHYFESQHKWSCHVRSNNCFRFIVSSLLGCGDHFDRKGENLNSCVKNIQLYPWSICHLIPWTRLN